MSNIQSYNIQQLIERWYRQEQEGVQFPVDFDIAWQIAGYSRKDSAKRALSNYLTENEDYQKPSQDELHKVWSSSQGKRSEVFLLSCDALKELCMLSRSEQGKTTRRYFIECEKKWKMVEKYHPQVAEDIEVLRMKEQQSILDKQIELARLEKEKEQAIFNAQSFRYTITQTCPEHIQQKVLGYTEIKTIEYRDRVIQNDELINDGSTVNKSWLCRRFGFLKKGQPDYKRLNAYLQDMPSDAFQLSAKIEERSEFKRDYLPMLQDLIETERQRFIGE